MRIGFLMDPLENVRVDHDSTFALMLECRRRGLEVRELRQEWLYVADGRARARMRTVEVQRRTGAHFQVLGDGDAALADLDVLFLRKDPPVDVEYFTPGESLARRRDYVTASRWVPYKRLDLAIDASREIVKKQYAWIDRKRTGKHEPLFLSAGQRHATFADAGVVALR